MTAPGPRLSSCSDTHLSLIGLFFILLSITHLRVASLPYRRPQVPTDSKGGTFGVNFIFPAVQSKYSTGHRDSMGLDQSSLIGIFAVITVLWAQTVLVFRSSYFCRMLPTESNLDVYLWKKGSLSEQVEEKMYSFWESKFLIVFPIFLPLNWIK